MSTPNIFDFSEIFKEDEGPKERLTVSISPSVLNEFKAFCKGNVSGAIERLMRLANEAERRKRESGISGEAEESNLKS